VRKGLNNGFLNERSFAKESSGFKSRPVHLTRTPLQSGSKAFNVVWDLKNRGYSERTLEGYSKRLKLLAKNTNLDNPESVKRFIANQEGWSNCYKEGVVNAYVHYVRFYGLD